MIYQRRKETIINMRKETLRKETIMRMRGDTIMEFTGADQREIAPSFGNSSKLRELAPED